MTSSDSIKIDKVNNEYNSNSNLKRNPKRSFREKNGTNNKITEAFNIQIKNKELSKSAAAKPSTLSMISERKL